MYLRDNQDCVQELIDEIELEEDEDSELANKYIQWCDFYENYGLQQERIQE